MSSPYELLLGLALLNEKKQQSSERLKGWTGVLVKAGENQVLIERHLIKEIVTIPQVAPVIDGREWLSGITSYEGELLSLIELRKLLNADAKKLGLKDRQIVIFNKEDGNMGFLVDQIIGSRHFWQDDTKLSDFDTSTDGMFKVVFSYEGEKVHVADHSKLVNKMGLKLNK